MADSGSEGEESHYAGSESFSLIARRTRGSAPLNIRAPLHQGVGAKGLVTIKMLFSVSDLRAWKKLARTYREDPEQVSKVMETIIRTKDPDWNDLQVILDTLVTYDDKSVVLAKARGRKDPSAGGPAGVSGRPLFFHRS